MVNCLIGKAKPPDREEKRHKKEEILIFTIKIYFWRILWIM
jgi:hypothetical protein